MDDPLIQPMAALIRTIDDRGGGRPVDTPARYAIALSGGPDSSAMAICAARLAPQIHAEIKLFHVHHGLLPEADQWLLQVRELARLLNLELIEQHVTVDLTQGLGVEASARLARHAALQQMARQHRSQAVLFAHHLQDQAETVLQRLLRGSGVLGVGAMRAAVRKQDCWWLRPWLGVSRSRILQCVEAFEKASGWKPVQDPTNLDPSLGRGVIRGQLASAIETHWPGWATNLARHAQQAQQAQELLGEYAQMLLEQIGEAKPADHGGGNEGAGILRAGNQPAVLDLQKWRLLTPAQQSLTLRTWLSSSQVQMPSEKRLAELCRQLNQVHALGHDRELHWHQTGCDVRCVRGKIHLQVTI